MRALPAICLAGLLAALPARADITIGLAAPLTGPFAMAGEQLKRGAEQAVADINAAGGIKGEKLVLREADDACDPKQAVAVANEMISSGIKLVVGHWCSGAAIPASKVYMEEGVVMISPASNSKLTDEGKDVIFRVGIRDNLQAEAAARYLIRHFRDKKIAILQDNSAYGRGFADQVKKALNEGGVQEAMDEAYTPGERDYSALVSKLKQEKIDAALIGGYHTEVGLIARQMKEQGAAITLLGGVSLTTSQLWSITGPAGEGILMVFGPDPRSRPEAKAAIEALRKSGFEPEGYTMYAYAAVQTAAEGLRRADKTQPLKIAAGIRAAPIETVLGKLSFDAHGDIAGFPVRIYRWHDGKYAETGE